MQKCSRPATRPVPNAFFRSDGGSNHAGVNSADVARLDAMSDAEDHAARVTATTARAAILVEQAVSNIVTPDSVSRATAGGRGWPPAPTTAFVPTSRHPDPTPRPTPAPVAAPLSTDGAGAARLPRRRRDPVAAVFLNAPSLPIACSNDAGGGAGIENGGAVRDAGQLAPVKCVPGMERGSLGCGPQFRARRLQIGHGRRGIVCGSRRCFWLQ